MLTVGLNLSISPLKVTLFFFKSCKTKFLRLSSPKRKYPSGIPEEKIFVLKTKDPTWRKEHFFFQNLIKKKDVNTSLKNLEKDFYISSQIKRFLKKIELISG